jgi:peptidyl-prolyl cis-trans isomerase SurA
MLLADSSLIKGQWKAKTSPKEEKELLFTLREKRYLAGDFFSYVKQNQRPTLISPEKYLDQLYNQYVDANIMKEMEDKIIRENPDYGFLLQEYYEGILLFDIMEKEVWSKASEDSVGQQLYYKSHLSDYNTGERAKVAFYSSSSNDFSEPLRQIILSGDESKIQDFVTAHKIKTESGYFKKEDRIVLQKVPWTKGVYPAENNGMYYLAWLRDILPPGPMSFDEARSAIISDYQTFLEKSWLEHLKRKYSVKVNDKGRKYILQQLQVK